MTGSLLKRVGSLAALAAALAAPAAHADGFGALAHPAFAPRVPISALARPLLAIDPSRLSISTQVSVGSGFGGGTNGLQVTSLSYRFTAPVWMRLSVGNAFGSPGAQNSSLFLEGADLAFRPSASTFFEIRYQNVRSPLQLQYSPLYRAP